MILLFIVSGLLITPIFLVSSAESVASRWGFQSTTFDSYVQTYVTLFVNVVLIPFFIDMMVLCEDFDTKSDRQVAILNRNFVFMCLNSVLLPLTHKNTI